MVLILLIHNPIFTGNLLEYLKFLPLNCPNCGQVVFYSVMNYSSSDEPGNNNDGIFDCPDSERINPHACFEEDVLNTIHHRINIPKLRQNFDLFFNQGTENGAFAKFVRLTLSPDIIQNNYTGFGMYIGKADTKIPDKKTSADEPPGIKQKYRIMKPDGRFLTVECVEEPNIDTGRFVRFKNLQKKGLHLFRCDTMTEFTPKIKEPDVSNIYLLTLSSEQADILEYRTGYFYQKIKTVRGKVINAYPAKITFKHNREIHTRKIRFRSTESAKFILETPSFLEHINITISQDDKNQ